MNLRKLVKMVLDMIITSSEYDLDYIVITKINERARCGCVVYFRFRIRNSIDLIALNLSTER